MLWGGIGADARRRVSIRSAAVQDRDGLLRREGTRGEDYDGAVAAVLRNAGAWRRTVISAEELLEAEREERRDGRVCGVVDWWAGWDEVQAVPDRYRGSADSYRG